MKKLTFAIIAKIICLTFFTLICLRVLFDVFKNGANI